jgi:hypothetical protein
MHSRWSGGSLSWGAFLLVVAALGAAGCSENPVGRRCFIGVDAGNDTQAIVASPALECPSRTCLHYPQDDGITPPEGAEYADMCTADCASDDECDKVPESPCISGFTCAVPVVVGPFCCRKMCICRDFLFVPADGLPAPEACNPDLPENTCANIR